jgi:hypothetical protein
MKKDTISKLLEEFDLPEHSYFVNAIWVGLAPMRDRAGA